MFEQLPSVSERDPGDVASEAVLVVDVGTGWLSYVDAEAAELFGIAADVLVARRADNLIAELAELAPRSFHATIVTPSGEREVFVRIESLAARPAAAGPFGTVLVRVRSLEPFAARPHKPDGRLESLWDLVVRRGLVGAEQVGAILREAANGIGLTGGSLARIEGEDLVEIYTDAGDVEGSNVPVNRTLARYAIGGSGSFAVLDTAASPTIAAIAESVRCFLSVAFRVGEEQWVLTFVSARARTVPFGDDDWRFVEIVIDALAGAIERRANDAHVERLAYCDALTTLPNRVAFLKRLDEALAESERLNVSTAVLFIDIDGFKEVNDTVGHRGGDRVLAEIAQRLRGTLRREEFIGRLGGDEFAIVMPQIAGRHETEAISQRISGVLTSPFAVDGYRFVLSASIGVAMFPEDARQRDDLLACADAAMYAAKDNGGARLRFRHRSGDFAEDRETAPQIVPSRTYVHERREIGYTLCFQPILEVRTNRILAAEALIRRIHPAHGLLAPERGWSIARDEAGRRALDRWVLREAAQQARAWHDAGLTMRIDVNLAAFDTREIDALLADPALASDVRRLRIEVAPEQFAEGPGHIGDFAEHCAKNGIGFALDGFDGGLSVLASLSHLPIDSVKLERALCETVAGSSTARAVVEGTVIVAKSMGWSVVAKGVETATQQDALVSLGCDGIQGFYVAHPMTAVDFATWLRERRPIGRRV